MSQKVDDVQVQLLMQALNPDRQAASVVLTKLRAFIPLDDWQYQALLNELTPVMRNQRLDAFAAHQRSSDASWMQVATHGRCQGRPKPRAPRRAEPARA